MGAYRPFELDITEFTQSGSNLLTVAVQNESIADELAKGEHYAKHPIGGILRDVTLKAVPNIHLSNCIINGTLNDDLRVGTLHVELDIDDKDSPRINSRLAVGTSISILILKTEN